MINLFKWRIFCNTENKFNYLWDTESPTTCPINNAHSININSIADINHIYKYKVISAVDSPYLITGYNFYRCDTSDGNITINLKSAIGIENRIIIIQKISGLNNLTIVPYNLETIDGVGSKILINNKSTIKLVSTGSNWTQIGVNTLDGECKEKLEGALYNDQYNSDELVLYENNDFRKLKLNRTAISDPTVDDDSNLGYNIGSRWINTVTNTEFVCTNSSTGAAVWVSLVASGINMLNVGIGEGLYKNVVSGTFNFKSIIDAGFNRTIISSNIDEVTIDVNEPNININNLSGPLNVNNGGTGNTIFTAGSIIFSDGIKLVENNANLYWNNTLNRFGIGTNTPHCNLDVNGSVCLNTGPINIHADINLYGNTITNVVNPVNNLDVVNKQYVDNIKNNSNYKDCVRVATIISGTLAVNFVNGSVIDGVTIATGDRILIKNQINPIENGIYIVQATFGIPIRVPDLNTGMHAACAFIFVEEGINNHDTGWLCITDKPNDIIGIHNNIWILFTCQTIIAGNGLSQAGNVFNVNTDNTSIGISSNSLYVINAPNNKGDLLTHDGTTQISLPVGTNNEVLTVDNTQPFGIKWGTVPVNNNIINVGTGQGLYKNLIANLFNFKSIKDVGFNRIIIGSTSDEVTVDVNEGNININNLNGVLNVNKGGTGNTIFTAGSIIFSDGVKLIEDNANLYWNNTLNRFGIGTNTPNCTLDVNGSVCFNTGPINSYTNININGNRITNVNTPINMLDVVNKQYVDSIKYNLNFKDCVRVATTIAGNIASSFISGTVIDGVILQTGDRILIKNQLNQIENGIYTVQSAFGIPIRTSDLDTGSHAACAFTFVEEGVINHDIGWLCVTNKPNDIIGSNNNTWISYGNINITAGNGLVNVSDTFNVNVDNTSIKIESNMLEIINPPVNKGDIFTHSGIIQSSLEVGNDNEVLIADSTKPLGLKWGPPPARCCCHKTASWVFSDIKLTAVNGGSAIANIWTQREVTVTEFTSGNCVTLLTGLDSNKIQFVPGIYSIHITATFNKTKGTKLRLQNATDNITIAESTNVMAIEQSNAILYTTLKTSCTKKYEIDYICSFAQDDDGLGMAVGIPCECEKYLVIHVLKLNSCTCCRSE